MKNRERRHNRIRAKIIGTAERPRLSVYKSNRYLEAQLIDDNAGKTLMSAKMPPLELRKASDGGARSHWEQFTARISPSSSSISWRRSPIRLGTNRRQ